MCSTSEIACIMAIISNFAIFFIFCIFIAYLLIFIFIACSLKDSQNFFVQSLPLYTSCLFSVSLNDNILDIEKADGIFSPTVVVDDFS